MKWIRAAGDGLRRLSRRRPKRARRALFSAFKSGLAARWQWVKTHPKRVLYTLPIALLLLSPGMGAFEDATTLCLARTLYDMGRGETYDGLLALGSVAANRLHDARFPDTLQAVLNEPRSFSRSAAYDERALAAAREIMMGRRVLPEDMLYFAAATPAAVEDTSVRILGGYAYAPRPMD